MTKAELHDCANTVYKLAEILEDVDVDNLTASEAFDLQKFIQLGARPNFIHKAINTLNIDGIPTNTLNTKFEESKWK